jgi:hypothetical protein
MCWSWTQGNSPTACCGDVRLVVRIPSLTYTADSKRSVERALLMVLGAPR